MEGQLPGMAARALRAASRVGLYPEEDGLAPSQGRPALDRGAFLASADAVPANAVLGAEAQDRAEPFERRGEPVIFIGGDGRVVHMNDMAANANGRLFGVVGGRIATVLDADQRRLDGLVHAAQSKGKPGLIPITVFSGVGQALALAVPVPVHSLNIAQPVSTLVIFLESGVRVLPVDEGALALLREGVGLTSREVDVIRLIAAGGTLLWAAGNLGIRLGTARQHLKAAFAKLGVHSQAELAMLVGRLG